MERLGKLTVLVCAVLAFSTACALPVCAQEFRGIWVDAFHPGFKTPEQTTEMVNKVADANLNAIFVQVRKRGDAYYTSNIVPKAKDVAPDYDPLADTIQKAHARGLEVHAWLTLVEVWNSKLGTPSAGHVSLDHADWLTRWADGGTVCDSGGMYLDPAHPEVRLYLTAVVSEIAEKYAVDGINLGDIAYPSRASGHNQRSLAQFRADTSITGIPGGLDTTWRAWRQEQLASLVQAIGNAVWQGTPTVKLSATVRPSLTESRMHFMQDWPDWLHSGLLDFVVPMNYVRDTSRFDANLSEALEQASDRHVYMGHGSLILSPEQATERISRARTLGCPGLVLYSYAYLLGNGSGDSQRMQHMRSNLLLVPLKTPEMPWKIN